MSLTRLARRKSFSCLHRYEVAAWSDEKNSEIFGACFTPNGHGHNYDLEVFFEGAVAKDTGMVLNLIDVDQSLSAIVAPLEGKHLNLEVAEFRDCVPTTEMIAQYLFSRLLPESTRLGVRLVKVRLYEHEDLWVDVWN